MPTLHSTAPGTCILVSGLSLAFMGALMLPAQEVQAPPGHVQIENLSVGLTPQGPVVLLEARNRIIPIFVDPTVARSIEGALHGEKFFRPLTHDLMHTVLEEFGGRVTKVQITLQDQIYLAELTITLNGHTKIFDSRSSDAIALAIHFQAPIFVGEALLKEQPVKPRDPLTPETFL